MVVAKVGAAMATAGGLALVESHFATESPELKLVIARSVSLLGLALTDGFLLGVVVRGLLGPGNRRGPRLKFST